MDFLSVMVISVATARGMGFRCALRGLRTPLSLRLPEPCAASPCFEFASLTVRKVTSVTSLLDYRRLEPRKLMISELGILDADFKIFGTTGFYTRHSTNEYSNK